MTTIINPKPPHKPTEQRFIQTGVKEVWFWEDGVISLHYLEGEDYSQVSQSKFLPNLDIARLAQCAAIPSRMQAVRQFRTKSN